MTYMATRVAWNYDDHCLARQTYDKSIKIICQYIQYMIISRIALGYMERWFDLSGYTSNPEWLNLKSKDLSFESSSFQGELEVELVNDSRFDEIQLLKEIFAS